MGRGDRRFLLTLAPPLLRPVLPLLVSWLLIAAGPGLPDEPRAVVRLAERSLEVDSVEAVATYWTDRLRRDSRDRAALLGLASLARLTADSATAERLYRRLLTDGPRRDRYAVYARIGAAQGLEAQGWMRGVVEQLRLAHAEARSLGDSLAEGEALLWLGHVLAPTAGGDVALASLDTALRVLPERALGLRAASRCRRAQILGVLGRADAPAELEAAMALVRRSGEPRSETYCLRAVVNAHDFRGELDSTLAAIRRLVELKRRTRDRSGLAFALALLGDKLRGTGNYGDVSAVLREALAEARASGNRFVEATVSLGLGALALALNDHGAAGEHVERAVAMFEGLGDTASAWQARHFRPFVSLAAGDPGSAKRQLAEALAWQRSAGNWNTAGLYKQLAYVAMREGDWAAARRALDSSRAAVPRTGTSPDESLLGFHYGLVALRRGDLREAERQFTRHLESLRPHQRLARYEGRVGLAEVYARGERLELAERVLTLAFDELESWRAGLAERELRVLAFQASGYEANDRGAGVATVLAALAAGGRAEAAFVLAERRRARELVDRLTQVRALHSGPAGSSRPPGEAGGVSAPADLAALLPDERTAVVEFVTGAFGSPTSVFVLTRPEPGRDLVRARVLAPADSIVEQVARVVALLEGGADPGVLARALGETLLDPVIALAGPRVERLVVVPDGPLHRVPWDALRLADGRYATERYAISIAPSAGVLAAYWRRHRAASSASRPEGPIRLLAFGDPASPPPGAVPHMVAGELPRLEGSAREARIVARYAAEAEVRLGREASAAFLRSADLTPFRVVHFAAHALVDERSALRTALVLAPGEGESGLVGPAELGALELGADLVVISACQSAGGVVVNGEGVQGLTSPLLQAGARAVVASGWRIGDRSAVAFMESFYAALARGLPLAEALRSARLDAIRRRAPPAEWAAFTAVGDPMVTIPLRHPPSSARWWLAGGMFIVTLGIIVRLVRGRGGESSLS